MRIFFNRLLPDLTNVFARFPVTIAISVFAFFFFAAQTADWFSLPRKFEERFYFSFFTMFIASGGVYLLAESRTVNKMMATLLAAIVAAIIGLLAFYSFEFSVNHLMLILALVLWPVVAGFLRSGVSFNAVWLFNSRLGLAIVLASIVGGLFFAGVSAIFASLEYLFNVKMPSDIYMYVANGAVTLVGALYGLSLIPQDINEELQLPGSSDLLNRGISILINYIMVPVLLVYVVILHAYAIKIAVTFILPKGQVGIMVLIFGIGGTAIWLIARPWVETGTRALKLFTRHWFWFTIIPTLMLCLAVYVRVEAYGVTPERYGLVLVAIWLLAMIVYFAIKRIEARPQFIIGSMAALLFIGSFGPWGAQEFSIASQLARFDVLLTQSGVAKDGKLVDQVPDTMPKADQKQVKSIVRFLRKQDRLDELKPYFADKKDSPFITLTPTHKIAKLINSQLKLGISEKKYINFNSPKPAEIVLPTNSKLFGPFKIYARAKVRKKGPVDEKNKRVSLNKKMFAVHQGKNTWQISHQELLASLSGTTPPYNLPIKLRLKGPGEMFLIVTSISGSRNAKTKRVTRLEGWLLFPAVP